ncbi:MAG: hypothetical protein ABDH32_05585 [Candidatus Caldarchaeales archaeon]
MIIKESLPQLFGKMISRRRYVKWIIAGLTIGIVGLIVYLGGIFRPTTVGNQKTETAKTEEAKTTITSPTVTEATETPSEGIFVGKVEDVQVGGQKYFTMNTDPDGKPGEHKAILIRLKPELVEKHGSEFIAFSAVCTHGMYSWL